MTDGLVSTIIPVHNRGEMLREAVASVLAQTHRPVEIIIVDDGSTDDTPQVADELAQSNPQEVRVFHQPNSGPGPAREAGRQTARGEFIQYLDSDDLLLPEKFARQVTGLRAHPECGVSYGMTRYRYADGRVGALACRGSGVKVETMFPAFLMSRWWCTSSPLYRRDVTDRAGPWLDLWNEEDWEYDCRIAAQDVRLHYFAEFISEERAHSGDRLSANGSTDARKLKHRARAHALILKHAQRAGIGEEEPEMQHFARELFLLSRQCGAAGLAEDSRNLFELARGASGAARGNGWDFKLYAFLASIAGWTRLGKMVCLSDSIRNER